MNQIKDFYDKVPFPGYYTLNNLNYHNPKIRNKYLKTIDQAINLKNPKTILDMGAGTGLISNLFAQKYKQIQITGIDFSNSIHYAKDFAEQHKICNVNYIQENILDFNTPDVYDLIICQGVLHHIPEYEKAVKQINRLLAPGGILVLGVYHPFGKILKKYTEIDYRSNILYQDQEHNPFEISFTKDNIKQLFTNFCILDSYPRMFINFFSFFNYKSGGLVTYIMEKQHDTIY